MAAIQMPVAFAHTVTHHEPLSPTLGSSEMILPYSREASSSSPIASSPTIHKNHVSLSPTSNVSSSPPQSQRNSDTPSEVVVATAIRMPIRVRAAPPSSMITANSSYQHGAPLSDIGEEESTPISKASRKSRSPSPVEPLSPTPAGRGLRHMRRLSDQSNSSIGSDWEDFDTSKMISGRLAADVAKLNDIDNDHGGKDSKRNSFISTTADDEMAILNARAEKILENARKRLTNMEDNLSKARNSILLTQRSSPNLNELHQPAGGLYRSISLASTAPHRKSKPLYPVVKSTPPVHSRGLSDTTPSSGLRRLSMVPEGRSSSAQEFARRAESPSYSLGSPAARYMTHSPASSRSMNSPMRILEEEDGSPSTTKTSPEHETPRGLGINTLAAVSKENISMVQAPVSPGLYRSPSAASTREIKEQISDLRDRISDLKSKSQMDKAKRNSRDSPNLLTGVQNPEKWYTSAPEYKEGESPLNANAGQGWSPRHSAIKIIDTPTSPITPNPRAFPEIEPPSTGRSKDTIRTDLNVPGLGKRTLEVTPNIPRAESVHQESQYEDAAQEFDDDDEPVAASEEEQVYLNEVLEESLQDVGPEIPEIPEHLLAIEGEAERHEDRLDAFDYENMFLHSVMGNYAGGAHRSESISESSDSSSVTTRRAEQETPTTGEEDEIDDDETIDSDRDEDDIEVDANNNERSRSVNGDTERFIHVPNPLFQEESLPTPKASLLAPPKPWSHLRANSLDSVSTAATFATANEGEKEDEKEDSSPHEILNWGNRNGNSVIPNPISTSPKKDATNAWSTPSMSARTVQAASPQQQDTFLAQQPSPIVNGNAFANGVLSSPQLQLAPSSATPVANPQIQLQPQVHHQSQSPQIQPSSLPPQASTKLRQLHSQSPYPESTISNTTSVSDHPANTEILMESLIKLADPNFRINNKGVEGSNSFADVDKELVLQLLRSVGSVCNGILKSDGAGQLRLTSVLRRRLDAARSVLDGEDDEEEEDEEEEDEEEEDEEEEDEEEEEGEEEDDEIDEQDGDTEDSELLDIPQSMPAPVQPPVHTPTKQYPIQQMPVQLSPMQLQQLDQKSSPLSINGVNGVNGKAVGGIKARIQQWEGKKSP